MNSFARDKPFNKSKKSIVVYMASFNDGGQLYYQHLLKNALANNGFELTLKILKNVSQKRLNYILSKGDIPLIHQFIETKDRNANWKLVYSGLTDGLIGKRVMLIPKGNAKHYAKVETLNDFRDLKKVAAFGYNWYDSKIWSENDLDFIEVDGEWRNSIYKMLSSQRRGVDYFPRGVIEVTRELVSHKNLEIEPRLLLVYKKDFAFYMPKTVNEEVVDSISQSLKKFEESGKMLPLMNKYWGKELRKLDLNKRNVIILK